jgi:hypothetical protein
MESALPVCAKTHLHSNGSAVGRATAPAANLCPEQRRVLCDLNEGDNDFLRRTENIRWQQIDAKSFEFLLIGEADPTVICSGIFEVRSVSSWPIHIRYNTAPARHAVATSRC